MWFQTMWQDFALEVKLLTVEKCSHAKTINPVDWRFCQVLPDVLSVTNRSLMDERLVQLHLDFVKCICWNYLSQVRNRSLMDVRLVFCWPKARQQSIRCWSAKHSSPLLDVDQPYRVSGKPYISLGSISGLCFFQTKQNPLKTKNKSYQTNHSSPLDVDQPYQSYRANHILRGALSTAPSLGYVPLKPNKTL